MSGSANVENLGGMARPSVPRHGRDTAQAIGEALSAVAQPDLFGAAANPETERLLVAVRQRRWRASRRAAAALLLAQPWCIAEGGGSADGLALARRFLRRYPERDRADPAPPLLTNRQEAALWHADEEMAEVDFNRAPW